MLSQLSRDAPRSACATKAPDDAPGAPAVKATRNAGVALPAVWEAPSRYTDQPTSLRTRLFGMGGVTGVAGVLAMAALVSWTALHTHAAQPAVELAVFDVAPPAAPPEPVREVKPGPEQIEKEQQRPRTEPAVDAPLTVPMPTARPVAVGDAPSVPAPIPAPPVKETTAPEAKPLPPATTPSNAAPTWQGRVLAALQKVRRYPREASLRRQEGVPFIRFVMNREGKVLSVRLERSSRVRSLDAEAVNLPKRAQPLPRPPEEVKGDTIELVVPVEFFLATDQG